MQRPATLTRHCSETATLVTVKRPVHLLLRAPSACHAVTMESSRQRSQSATRPLPSSRPTSSSSYASSTPSIFDESHNTSYYGDLSDTEDDDDDNYGVLDLSDSGFTSVPAQLLAETDCCMGIQSLDMSQNQLDGEQEEYLSEQIVLPNLSSLCLQNCKVTSLEPLCKHLYAPNLRVLDISNHHLQGSVPNLQRYFPRLDTLIAKNGLFEHVDESATSGLTHVDLSNNRVTDDDGRLEEQCRQQGTELVL